MTPSSYFYWSLAIVLLVVFSLNKFYSENTEDPTKFQNRVLAQVLSRDRVFAEKFLSFALVYMFVMIVLFLTIVFLGQPLGLADAFKGKEFAWPFFSALVVIGFASPVPWVGKLELIIRGKLQKMALISSDVEKAALGLKTLAFTPDRLNAHHKGQLFAIPTIAKEFDDGTLNPETMQWLRSGILIFSMQEALAEQEIIETIGGDFIARYEPLLKSIDDDRRSIQEQLDLTTSTTQSEFEAKLSRARVAIGKLYDDVRNFAACILVRRPESVEVPRAMMVLGVEPSATQILAMKRAREASIKFEILIYGYFVAGVASIVIYALFHLLPGSLRKNAAWAVQWPLGEDIGRNLYPLFMDLFWFGLVLWAASRLRARMVREDDWYGPDPAFDRLQIPKPSSYLKLALRLTLVAAISLFTIGAISLLTADNKCAPPAGGLETCGPLLKDYALRFLPKEILKLFAIIVAAVAFLALTENIKRRSLIEVATRSLAIAALSSFLFALYIFKNETSIPYGSSEVSQSALRTGLLTTGIAAVTIFWVVFVFYTSLQQTRILARGRRAHIGNPRSH